MKEGGSMVVERTEQVEEGNKVQLIPFCYAAETKEKHHTHR